MDDDLTTLVNLVRSMRNAQKEYFKRRSQEALIDSRKYEGLVDTFIKRFDGKNKPDDVDLGPELPF